VAIDLAAELGNQTPLPVRWLLSQKFDSIDKIADIHMPFKMPAPVVTRSTGRNGDS
jgi:hypothetical protein